MAMNLSSTFLVESLMIRSVLAHQVLPPSRVQRSSAPSRESMLIQKIIHELSLAKCFGSTSPQRGERSGDVPCKSALVRRQAFEPRKQKPRIEAVPCPDGVYRSHRYSLCTKDFATRANDGALPSAFHRNTGDTLRKHIERLVQSISMRDAAGLCFVWQQNIDMNKQRIEQIPPRILGIVVGIERDG